MMSYFWVRLSPLKRQLFASLTNNHQNGQGGGQSSGGQTTNNNRRNARSLSICHQSRLPLPVLNYVIENQDRSIYDSLNAETKLENQRLILLSTLPFSQPVLALGLHLVNRRLWHESQKYASLDYQCQESQKNGSLESQNNVSKGSQSQGSLKKNGSSNTLNHGLLPNGSSETLNHGLLSNGSQETLNHGLLSNGSLLKSVWRFLDQGSALHANALPTSKDRKTEKSQINSSELNLSQEKSQIENVTKSEETSDNSLNFSSGNESGICLKTSKEKSENSEEKHLKNENSEEKSLKNGKIEISKSLRNADCDKLKRRISFSMQSELAVDLVNKGFVEEGLRMLKRMAKNGEDENHPQTLHNIGVVYEKFKMDQRRAFSYYKKAADLGYQPSLYNLAVIYENGFPGLKPDSKKAEKCLKKAEKKMKKEKSFERKLFEEFYEEKTEDKKVVFEEESAEEVYQTALDYQHGLRGRCVDKNYAMMLHYSAAVKGHEKAKEEYLKLRAEFMEGT